MGLNEMMFAGVLVIVFFVALGLCIWLTNLSVAAGATLFSIGAAGAVGWLAASIGSNMIVESELPTPRTNANILNVTSEELAQILTGGGTRQWESIAETKTWYNQKCNRSLATYTMLDNGVVRVHNECTGSHKFFSDITGEARTTELPAVLSVSFFPGIVAQYVVHDKDAQNHFLIVTSRDQTAGWLLHRVGHKASEEEIGAWRDKFKEKIVGKQKIVFL